VERSLLTLLTVHVHVVLDSHEKIELSVHI